MDHRDNDGLRNEDFPQSDYRNGDDSSDTEDEGYHRDRVERVSLREVTITVLRQIKEGKLDLTQQEQRDVFDRSEGRIMVEQSEDRRDPTALHLIVNLCSSGAIRKYPGLKALIYYLVRDPSNLLCERDYYEGATALLRAIAVKNETLARTMCEAASNNISSVLGIASWNKDNCVHLAIKKRRKITQYLIDLASATTMAAKDQDGNTPLHLAVEYEACREGQEDIVRQIISKTDQHERELEDDFNNQGLSPYLYHHMTCKMGREKRAESRDTQVNGSHWRSSVVDHGNRRKEENDSREPRDDTWKTENSNGVSQISAVNGLLPELRSRPALVPENPQEQDSSISQQGRQWGSVPSSWTKELTGEGSHHEREAKAKEHNKEKARKSSSSRVDETVVSNVGRILKLHYLQSRSDENCVELLYGKGTATDKEIYFDLSGRTSMTQTGFDNLLSLLSFGDALKYVAIPKLKIHSLSAVLGSDRRQLKGKSSDSFGNGRQDFVRVFKELGRKGVGTILKVIVDDTDDPPHSDEAIENALRFMDVDVWDWKRIDLDSEVIFKAAKNVREVNLYWSGNNAVLRGWSDQGGLKCLENLERVNLHIQKGTLETKDRINIYLATFKRRMTELCPKAMVYHIMSTKESTYLSAHSNPRTDGSKNDRTAKPNWIESIDEFRKALFTAERNFSRDDKTKTKVMVEEPIKVALIDDGVDVMELTDCPILGGRTFCPRDEQNNLNHPYYASGTGHGTIMAQQIHFMCPKAQLYVLRLNDCISERGVRQIVAKSAAQAIRAAIKKKVHIISMSWTIDPLAPEEESVREELESAIKEAVKEKILMFCSASDRGAQDSETYPSKATQNIFKIGAATPSGRPDQYVRNVDLIFPGSDTVQTKSAYTAQPPFDGPNMAAGGTGNEHTVSGSSVATAVASGLAALILYCVQLWVFMAESEEKRKIFKERFEEMKLHGHMKRAFRDIGVNEDCLVEVWKAFGDCDKVTTLQALIKKVTSRYIRVDVD